MNEQDVMRDQPSEISPEFVERMPASFRGPEYPAIPITEVRFGTELSYCRWVYPNGTVKYERQDVFLANRAKDVLDLSDPNP